MRTDAALFLRGITFLVAHDCLMTIRGLNALVARMRTLPLAIHQSDAETETSVIRALGLACSFYPKQVLCLQRSAVLVRLLRSEGIAARVLIGVRKVPFLAHAWVEVDGRIIDDRLAEQEAFLVLEEC